MQSQVQRLSDNPDFYNFVQNGSRPDLSGRYYVLSSFRSEIGAATIVGQPLQA